jgi:hypothetical protein
VKLALALAFAACSTHPSPTHTMPTEHHWQVFDGSLLILELSDRPGAITSTSDLPPGTPPVTSSYMSAAARDAMHEGALREILEASPDLAAFLAGLQRAGYVIKPVGG